MNAVIRLSSCPPESPATPRRALWLRRLPFYWSLRRELWEHPSLYLAPLIVAGVVLAAISAQWLRAPQMLLMTEGLRPLGSLPPQGLTGEWVFGERHIAISGLPVAAAHYMTNLSIVLAGVLVGSLYCLDALQGERRSRSILFWKSLPVSDRTVVLSKAATALVMLPCVLFATMMIADAALLIVASAIVSMQGESAATLWSAAALPGVWLDRLFIALAAVLWYAPLLCWPLFVSGFAPSKPMLWALAPALLALFERVVLGKRVLLSLLGRRLFGGPLWTDRAFLLPGDDRLRPGGPLLNFDLGPLDRTGLFASSELWAGAALALVFLLGAIWLRRRAGPM